MGRSERPVLSGRRSGQGLVEFALVLPLVLLLLLGVVEFARAWNIELVLTDAGREGARTLAVSTLTDPGAKTDSVTAVIHRALIRNAIDPDAVNVDLRVGQFSGDSSRVTLEYPYQLRVLQGLVGWTGADATITLRASTVMRTE